MLNLSTITARDTFKYLVQTYGPLFSAGATIIAATVASVAARAALRSAHASERNVETAKLSMELGNRAYISVSKYEFIAPVGIEQIVQVRVNVENVGKTLAENIEARVSADLFHNDFGPNIPTAPIVGGITSLAPNQHLTYQAFFEELITADDFAALNKKTAFIFFWGSVSYRDVFNKEHVTTWCVKYEPGAPKQIVIHPFHNNMT